ncbi:uncharacterized protein [Spinacia oleracea]|nr:uncharacterized protein LOC130472546 isoform X2 [Spinacia oleracea]
MPPPKSLMYFVPLPGQKLKSVVVSEPPPVDQPFVEETVVLSPLKLSTPLGVSVQDVTEEMEAFETDPIVPEGGKTAEEVPLEEPKDPRKTMVDLTGSDAAMPSSSVAEKVDPLSTCFAEDGSEQGKGTKRPRETLGSTSTSALDRLIHADPCSDVPLKRIPEEVRQAMAQYARPTVLGEDPLAHVGSLVGPEATRENLLWANPQWRVPGAEERNPAMMAQYYLNEAVFWSSFASECSSVEERKLKRYQEAYARDIPILDQKVGQLLSELVEVKQLYLKNSREARAIADEIGAEVGKLTFQVEGDAEKIALLEKEKEDMSTKFAGELEEKDRLLKEMKPKFEAADKESKEAEARLQQFVKNRELVQNEANKVPTLRLQLREKDDLIGSWSRRGLDSILLTSVGNSTGMRS